MVQKTQAEHALERADLQRERESALSDRDILTLRARRLESDRLLAFLLRRLKDFFHQSAQWETVASAGSINSGYSYHFHCYDAAIGRP